MLPFSKPSSKSSLRTTPWRRRRDDGVYFGHSGHVWAYFELPMTPMQWEDARARLDAGANVESILLELGATSADIGGGMRTLAIKRSLHVFSASFDRFNELPATTPAHTAFLSQVLPTVEPSKTLLIGVRLWTDLVLNVLRGGGAGGNLLNQFKAVMARNDKSGDSFDPYMGDYEEIKSIMFRNGAKLPRPDSLAQLESWFNYGNGPDAQVLATSSNLRVTGGGDWELSAVTKFTNPVLQAPGAQWLLDAMTHQDPAVAISVRAELTPATVVQAQLRSSQRKLRAAEEEEAKTGDISRDELAEKSQFAKELENTVRNAPYAWLSEASVLMARGWTEYASSNESYLDMLRNAYGIEAKPLEHRQLEALDEMQPCSTTTSNPFAQTLNPALIAYAGLPAFSNIGDENGMWIGRVDPDYSSVFVHPFGAPLANKAPVTAIFGDPGSGKASALTAKVLTPSGWTLMGNICVGDDVVGRDGKTYRVKGVYPQGVVPIYRVKFNDGASTEVTGDHLWAVATSGRLAKGHDWQIRTTDELRESLLAGQGERQWRIPMAAPVDRADVALPVDPYLLGVLVGDGNLTHLANFSTADAEIVDAVSAAVPGLHVKHLGRHDYQIQSGGPANGAHPLKAALRDLGLWGHKSLTKFLPEPYKWGSIAQRFALLQGLLDTDGTVGSSGSVIYYTSSEKLAADVVELVQSLGGTGRLRSKIPTYTHDGEKETGQRAYRVTICLPNELGAPFRLTRKADLWKPRPQCVPSRSIAEITYVRDDEAQCIAVTAPDRLYVTDDYIVTHNTFLAQLMAGQAALGGVQTIMINPKGFDSLASFVDWTKEFGIPSQVISMQAMEGEGGAFDPFRFVAPVMAAEILLRHITTVIGQHAGGISMKQEIMLGDQLKKAAEEGARCAGEAMAWVTDTEVRELIMGLVRSSSLFSLGFSMTPKPEFTLGGGLTLIEFDRELPLPDGGKDVAHYEREERIAVGAMRLVTRASMEILMRSKGGVLVVDEAHHYLGSPEGLASLQRLGREGRSLRLLPIFLTQRVSDLQTAEMENYLSRVFVMKLTDEKQAVAALKLCGLQPTPDRIAFLRNAGPRKGSEEAPGRGALGFFRDIYDRHSVVMVGPIPEDVRLAFSTNPEDKERRAAMKAAATGVAEGTA